MWPLIRGCQRRCSNIIKNYTSLVGHPYSKITSQIHAFAILSISYPILDKCLFSLFVLLLSKTLRSHFDFTLWSSCKSCAGFNEQFTVLSSCTCRPCITCKSHLRFLNCSYWDFNAPRRILGASGATFPANCPKESEDAGVSPTERRRWR